EHVSEGNGARGDRMTRRDLTGPLEPGEVVRAEPAPNQILVGRRPLRRSTEEAARLAGPRHQRRPRLPQPGCAPLITGRAAARPWDIDPLGQAELIAQYRERAAVISPRVSIGLLETIDGPVGRPDEGRHAGSSGLIESVNELS